MTYLEIFIIAISLCFDTVAVSIIGGMCRPEISFAQKLRPMLIFGFVQGGFLFAGWLLGSGFLDYITSWDHWIAFLLLLYIGGKMLIDGIGECVKSQSESSAGALSEQADSLEQKCSCQLNEHGKPACDLLSVKTDIKLGIATSIDAAAVGISMAMISIEGFKMAYSVFVTALVTSVACYIGVTFGKVLGRRFSSRASLLGGIVLIAIGVKILLEHIL